MRDQYMPADLSYLKQYTEGDMDELEALLEIFYESSQEGLDALRKSLKDGNLKEWRSAAHKLKGVASYVGAETLRALCEASELIEDNEFESCSERYTKIVAQYEEVCIFLKAR